MNESGTKAAMERWKQSLPDQDIALCEAINGELLDELGYQRSGIAQEWSEMAKPLLSDERLTGYFRRWLTASQGVEEFPTDPLVRENWHEVATEG